MSSSPVIPKEKLSAYQRWELHAFDAPANAAPTVEKKAAADAEKVRHIHQHAYDAGRADGLREGAQKAVAEAQQLKDLLTAIESQSHEINQRIAHDVLEQRHHDGPVPLRVVLGPEQIAPVRRHLRGVRDEEPASSSQEPQVAPGSPTAFTVST